MKKFFTLEMHGCHFIDPIVGHAFLFYDVDLTKHGQDYMWYV